MCNRCVKLNQKWLAGELTEEEDQKEFGMWPVKHLLERRAIILKIMQLCYDKATIKKGVLENGKY